jgi:hypothetical protein
MLLLDLISTWHCNELSVCMVWKLLASTISIWTWYCNNSVFWTPMNPYYVRTYVIMWMVTAKLEWSWLSCWKVWNPSWFHGLPGLYGIKYVGYLLRQVISYLILYKLVGSVTKILRIKHTVNSYHLLFPRDNYMLLLSSLFVLSALVLCIEDLCNIVTKDPRVILVTYFIEVNNY